MTTGSNPAYSFQTAKAREGLTPAPAVPGIMGVDIERPYVCNQCGDVVMLRMSEPLPPGWRATGAGRGTRYHCGCKLPAGEAAP